MNRIVSAVLLAVGIVLLVMGFSAADSVGSSFSRIFRGTPTDRATWLILGGVAATVASVVSFALTGRGRPTA
jgi:hypothetical protein